MDARKRRGRPPHDDLLTPTEWRIVHAVQHGMTYRQIAERKGISRDGVKFHVENILAKLGLANRQALRGWFRPPRNSAVSQAEGAAVTATSLGLIGQISRTVSDIKRAEHWYSQVLGLRHLYTFGKLAFFDCAGTRLLLTQEGVVSTSESILYFRVDNIEQAYQSLKARGIEFINAPHMIHRHDDGTEEWMAFFKDPEDRPMAVMSQAKA